MSSFFRMVALATVGAGCVGNVSSSPPEAPADPPVGAPTMPPPKAQPTPGDLPWPLEFRGRPSGLRRLSRNEIVASAELLTGMTPNRRDLPDEPRTGHGALLTGGMPFIPTEVFKLKQALAEFAAKAAPAALTRSGCKLQGQAQKDCLAPYFQRTFEQGWRRPLAPAEIERIRKLLELVGTPDGDLVAMEGALVGLFFSPSFLYRTEVGTPAPGRPGVNVLGPFEIAARLSFLATQAPPDTELMDAAKAGRLGDAAERQRHLDRLVRTERGKRALTTLMLEWLGAGEPKIGEKSSKYLAGLTGDIEGALKSSAEEAVRKGVLESAQPTVGTLLSTTTYLADATVGKVRAPAGMGKTASGDMDLTVRLGLLMHPHVLAAHTKEDGASPFQMGLFVRQNLLCQVVPEPPPGAQAEAKANPPAGLTLREDLEFRTNVGGACQTCHQQFAPLGYAFLPFDPVGRWILQDPIGKPWNLAGNVDAYGGPLAFTGPDDLVRKLADSPQLHGCFAQGAIEWALGRPLIEQDRELVDAAAATATRSRGDVIALLSAIVGSPAFTNVVVAR